MSTQFTNRQWRLPNNENKDKQSNYSMDFDSASSDYIAATISALDNATALTFSGWFKKTINNVVGFESFVSSTDRIILYWWSDNNVYWSVRNGSASSTASGVLTIYDWNHIVGTFDGATNTIKLYINGSLVDTETGQPSLTSANLSNNFHIGLSNGNTYNNGQIDGVSIFDYALSQSQVTTLYGSSSTGIGNPMSLSPKPVAYYPLGDQDAFNGANYLVPNIAAEEDDGDIAVSYSPYALDFDSASSDYIDCGTGLGNSLGTVTSLSVSVWIKTSHTPLNEFPFYIGNFSNSYGAFNIYTINSAVQIMLNNNAYSVAVQNVNLNDWKNIIFVYDGSNENNSFIYINGQQQNTSGSGTFPSSLNLSGLKTLIGAGYNTPYSFDGQISNASIWNAALTSSQVTEIYNEGVPSNLNNHSAYSNLVSWWQLGNNTSWVDPYWIALDEKGTNNGQSQNVAAPNNMGEDAIVDGVGSYANGLSSGMGGDEVIGDAPYSTANALSVNMDVEDRVTDVPPNFDTSSFLYDGVDEYFSGSSVYSELDGLSNYAVSCWVKSSNYSQNLEILNIELGASNKNFNIKISSNRRVNFAVNFDASYYGYTDTTTLVDNQWFHILATRDNSRAIGDKFRIYINGVNKLEYDSSRFAGTLLSATEPLHIGKKYSSSSNLFDGEIDEVAIYDQDMASYVSEIYAGGKVVNLNNLATAPNPVSYFRSEQATWDGSDWSMKDINSTYTVTSNNMEQADKTTNVP